MSAETTIAGYLAAWLGAGFMTLIGSLPAECFFAGCFLGFCLVGVHSRVTRWNSVATIVITSFVAGSLPPFFGMWLGLPREGYLFVAVFSAIAWPFISLRLHEAFFATCNKLILAMPDILPDVIKKLLSKKWGGG
ncbi:MULTISPECIES: hypothetical protein [Vitreoscilla]|uniref:Uncharacterized protein n=1 Tax=Vitreoscilla stercoraria TaxID=61 RepID=A0ABY4ECF4_VITST|nr:MULTISPECIES: hypothetical protein [Vitreoscilla]AUZ05226.1 hypothetical protein ADP71_16990 [Vitreoscilla sp. C1]UOO93428.1 hypothetical protein LVJ81_05200 [Vitreoscilla stercoraria]